MGATPGPPREPSSSAICAPSSAGRALERRDEPVHPPVRARPARPLGEGVARRDRVEEVVGVGDPRAIRARWRAPRCRPASARARTPPRPPRRSDPSGPATVMHTDALTGVLAISARASRHGPRLLEHRAAQDVHRHPVEPAVAVGREEVDGEGDAVRVAADLGQDPGLGEGREAPRVAVVDGPQHPRAGEVGVEVPVLDEHAGRALVVEHGDGRALRRGARDQARRRAARCGR